VDTALDKNQSELGVLVLSVGIKMLSDLDGLLDKHVKILRDFRGKSVRLENTDDLLSSHAGHLGNTVRVTKDDTNLGRGKTLLGKITDLRLNIRGGDLAPAGGRALVRAGALGDTLTWCVHATHAVIVQGEIERFFVRTSKNTTRVSKDNIKCCYHTGRQ